MKRTYTKLIHKFLNRTLKQNHVDESRASDALIANLLGWSDIDMDNNKEWVGDAPSQDKDYDCLGRCVIPHFTTKDINYLCNALKNILKNNHLTIEWDASTLLGIITDKKNGKTIVISANTLPLLLARIFVEIKKNK